MDDDGFVDVVYVAIWDNFPNYEIYSDGRIFSKFIMDFLNPTKTKNGYHVVTLFCKNKKSNLLVHRIIAKLFIPNLKNKPEVNHKDSNKLNNDVKNLEWLTKNEHAKHTAASGNVKYAKIEVYQFDLTGKLIGKFDSYVKAAKAVGIKKPNLISTAISNKTLFSGGYYWSKTNNLNMLNNGRSSPCERICLETGDVLQWYPSVREANRHFGETDTDGKIRRACQKITAMGISHGFGWRFVERPIEEIEEKFTEWKKWKSPPGFPKYRISKDGRLYSIASGKLLIPTNNGGYYQSSIYNDQGKRKSVKIHILVAKTYIPLPKTTKRLVVNHIDENTHNNKVENLEWITQKENVQHSAYKNKTSNKRTDHKRYTSNGAERKVGQYIKGTDTLIKTYKSATAAAKIMKVSRTCISDTVRGKQKSCCGYDWRYMD